MYKLLKKSDDPKLKEFIGNTVIVKKRPDNDYEGVFNKERIIIPKECLSRSKAEEGAKALLDLFIKGRERLEKKFGVNQCVSQYSLAYEHEDENGNMKMSLFTNAAPDFLYHECLVVLSKLFDIPYKETFDRVSKALEKKAENDDKVIDVEAEEVKEVEPKEEKAQ